jgi:hypothetical protein
MRRPAEATHGSEAQPGRPHRTTLSDFVRQADHFAIDANERCGTVGQHNGLELDET